MSSDRGPLSANPGETAARRSVSPTANTAGLAVNANEWLDDQTEKRLDEIEMLGEEEAAELPPPGRSAIGPALRYLHASRTIHQLVTDRNRAVGLYLAVASLLWTASSALLNARPMSHLMVPIEVIQRWCLPATFGTLTVLALFVGFMLIRARIGLIYEVAKMNALLGLPVGRVKRINPLSLFFLMHLLISLAGGCSAGLLVAHLTYDPKATDPAPLVLSSVLAGCGLTLLLILVYMGTVLYTTADRKLSRSST
jgi:hypothetical protein